MAPNNNMATKQAVKKSKITQATQMYLDIAEIKNDTVIMKDGTLRAIMLASSINFALKSEEEQNALISAYVSFLNYLDFPIQIVVQSRKLDIDKYLGKLDEAQKTVTNELLKNQLLDYKAYIQELVELGDIMTKKFFLVVPYSPIESKKMNFWTKLGTVLSPAKVIKLKQEQFNKYLNELNLRVDHVVMNISSLSIATQRLDTQSLIELFYNIYNPDVSPKQKLADIDNLNVNNA